MTQLREGVEVNHFVFRLKAGTAGAPPGIPPGVYEAGQTPAFFLEVENQGKGPRSINVVLRWRLKSEFEDFTNDEPLTIVAESGGPYAHAIRRQWLLASGRVVYTLVISQSQTVIEAHPLASFRVIDRAEEAARDAKEKRFEDLQRSTLWAFRMSVAASAILAAVGLILTFAR